MNNCKVGNFDADIPFISEIKFEIGGFFSGIDITVLTGDGKYMQYVRCNPFKIRKETGSFPIRPEPTVLCTKKTFFKNIQKLNIGDWDTDYWDPDILDGTQWSLEISFSNGRPPIKVGGSNAFPDNFNELRKMLKHR